MAETTVRTCDIYGTTKDVRRFNITVVQVVEGEDCSQAPDYDAKIDLGPKALDRLIGFLNRGITKPGAST